MNKRFLTIFFVVMIFFSTIAIFQLVQIAEGKEGAIPPTRAFSRINTSMVNGTVGNVTAQNSTATVEYKGSGGIGVLSDYINNIINFFLAPASGGTTVFIPATVEDLTNVTDNGCVSGDVRQVNATGWYVCAAMGGGGGEANTASNVGSGVGVFRSKVGVDLTFHSLLAGLGITIVDTGDQLQINSTGGGITSVSNTDPNADAKLVHSNGTSFANIKGLNGTAGQIAVANGTTSAVISLIPKFDNYTCSGGQFANLFDNATGDTGCGTPTDTGITSISNVDPNADIKLVFDNSTTRATIKGINGTSGNVTATNGTTSAQINIGPNVVVLTGVQTLTDKVINVGRNNLTATSGALGDILKYNGSNYDRFARGSNGQCLTSTSGDIAWGTCAAGGSGITSVSDADPNAQGKIIYLNTTTTSVLKGINGTLGNATVSNGTTSLIINTGDNVVVTNGLKQNVTKQLAITGYSSNLVTVTADYTATVNDDTILFQIRNNVTLGLPTAVGNAGKLYYIAKTGEFDNATIIIDPNGSERIGGNGTRRIYNQDDYYMIQSNNTDWNIIDQAVRNIVGGYMYHGAAYNRWYGAGVNNAAISTLTATANTLKATPLLVTNTFTTDQLAIEISGSSANNNCQAGVYVDGGNLYPTTRLFNSGNFSTTATGVKTVYINPPLTLYGGVMYWLAWNCDSSTPLFRAWAIASLPNILGTPAAMGSSSQTSGITVASTFGVGYVLPDPFLTGATFQTNANVPQIMLRSR